MKRSTSHAELRPLTTAWFLRALEAAEAVGARPELRDKTEIPKGFAYLEALELAV